MAQGDRVEVPAVGGASLRRRVRERETRRLIWVLALGALGLAWSITTVAAYLPPILQRFTSSTTLIGFVLACEGIFAIVLPLVIGPMSDATRTPFGRRRPYMAFAIAPMTLALVMVAFMPGFAATAFVLFAFFFAYYIYEPPYRGLYPDLLPDSVYGRAQGAQHVMRGIAIGAALVGGGVLLAVWEPFPFVLAAAVTAASCTLVIVLTREPRAGRRRFERIRSYLAQPFRIVKGDRDVRRFLIANTAWEATFAGMRSFVVLYITVGLDQPFYVSSAVLAVVAIGYVVAAALSGLVADRFGIARVILVASAIYGVGTTLAVLVHHWHWWYYLLVAPIAVAGGATMTLAWGLLFKIMPPRDQGAITGLAIVTKGVGLIVGPLAVGAMIEIFSGQLGSTGGYGAMWPVIGIPILAVTPLVYVLSRVEREHAGRMDERPV